MTPQYSKTPLYSDHPQVQNKFGIEDDNETEKFPGFHTVRVLTKRCLRTDISIVIIPTLLGRLYCYLVLVFGVIIGQVVFYTLYICL